MAEDGEEYTPSEFERRWTNPGTNELMMQEFDRRAHESYRELAPGLDERADPGKAIVFAITKNHATRRAKILNDLHPEAKGNYATIITSDVVAICDFKGPGLQLEVTNCDLKIPFLCFEIPIWNIKDATPLGLRAFDGAGPGVGVARQPRANDATSLGLGVFGAVRVPG